MHTYKAPAGTVFNFDSDFSGNVEIKSGIQPICSIPAHDILALVAYEYIEKDRIEKIENMTYRDLLK